MYSLAHDTWDTREVSALQKVMDSGRYTMGPEVAKFENEFAKKLLSGEFHEGDSVVVTSKKNNLVINKTASK